MGASGVAARVAWASLVALAVAPLSLDAPVGRVVITTCEGCALFAHPELKRFLVTQRERYVDQYPNVDVVYERGRSPVLVAYSRSSVELFRADLTKHGTVDRTRALLASLGFAPRQVFAEEPCADQHDDCAWWARHGRCDTRFVAERCAKSCRTCAKDEL